jgi:hypothetical protein
MESNIISGCCTLAIAGLAALAAPAMAAGTRLAAEQYEGPVGYVTGGIGKNEARLFERQLSNFPLAIELLEHEDKAEAFTGDALVKISDAHGHTVLDAKAGGPFLLVDLPPGRYSIVASLNHAVLRKPVVYVSQGHAARATFEFPARTD